MNTDPALPRNLKLWFVIHFAVDMAFAIPLIIAPAFLLQLLGWTTVEPVTARLVGAALLAIGLQSFIGRNDSADAFRAMLNLKIIWSIAACISLVICLISGAPVFTWVILGIFAPFCLLWIRYRMLLRQPSMNI